MDMHAFQPAFEVLKDQAPGIVAFDADYTLWADDIGFAAWNEAMVCQSLRPEATEALAEELRAIGALPREEPHADGQQLMELEAMGAIDGDVLVSFMATAFAGYTPAELENIAREITNKALKGRIYEGLRSFLDGLIEVGHTPIVVSASAEPLVWGAVSGFDLPIPRNHVFGVQTRIADDGKIGIRAIEPVCHHAGKVARLKAELGVESVIGAASDSVSDLPLLEFATCARLAVNPSSELAAAVPSDEPVWQVIRPLRDERGRAVVRYPDSMWV